MNKEKQIEKMAKTVCHLERTCDQCMTSFECKAMTYAKRFYNAGYRKISDVAREIFEEIEEARKDWGRMWQRDYYGYGGDADGYLGIDVEHTIYELKKKYTEGGE